VIFLGAGNNNNPKNKSMWEKAKDFVGLGTK
jgi:hypothetical protein